MVEFVLEAAHTTVPGHVAAFLATGENVERRLERLNRGFGKLGRQADTALKSLLQEGLYFEARGTGVRECWTEVRHQLARFEFKQFTGGGENRLPGNSFNVKIKLESGHVNFRRLSAPTSVAPTAGTATAAPLLL